MDCFFRRLRLGQRLPGAPSQIPALMSVPPVRGRFLVVASWLDHGHSVWSGTAVRSYDTFVVGEWGAFGKELRAFFKGFAFAHHRSVVVRSYDTFVVGEWGGFGEELRAFSKASHSPTTGVWWLLMCL
jgi:hypothetical protein